MIQNHAGCYVLSMTSAATSRSNYRMQNNKAAEIIRQINLILSNSGLPKPAQQWEEHYTGYG